MIAPLSFGGVSHLLADRNFPFLEIVLLVPLSKEHSFPCELSIWPRVCFSASRDSFKHVFLYTVFRRVKLLCPLFPKHVLDMSGHVRMHSRMGAHEYTHLSLKCSQFFVALLIAWLPAGTVW